MPPPSRPSDRNAVWRTNLSLWEDTAAKNTTDGLPARSLGAAYLEQGDHAKAQYLHLALQRRNDALGPVRDLQQPREPGDGRAAARRRRADLPHRADAEPDAPGHVVQSRLDRPDPRHRQGDTDAAAKRAHALHARVSSSRRRSGSTRWTPILSSPSGRRSARSARQVARARNSPGPFSSACRSRPRHRCASCSWSCRRTPNRNRYLSRFLVSGMQQHLLHAQRDTLLFKLLPPLRNQLSAVIEPRQTSAQQHFDAIEQGAVLESGPVHI